MNGNLFIGALSTLSERIIDGGVIFVQGLLTVFAVLAILWGALALFKVFFYDIPEKKKNKSEEKASLLRRSSLSTQALAQALPSRMREL